MRGRTRLQQQCRRAVGGSSTCPTSTVRSCLPAWPHSLCLWGKPHCPACPLCACLWNKPHCPVWPLPEDSVGSGESHTALGGLHRTELASRMSGIHSEVGSRNATWGCASQVACLGSTLRVGSRQATCGCAWTGSPCKTLPPLAPSCAGERSPMNDSNMRAAFVGISSDTGRPHMLRAVRRSDGLTGQLLDPGRACSGAQPMRPLVLSLSLAL